jgi:hypothetical protein
MATAHHVAADFGVPCCLTAAPFAASATAQHQHQHRQPVRLLLLQLCVLAVELVF